jgi:hypothetical protein
MGRFVGLMHTKYLNEVIRTTCADLAKTESSKNARLGGVLSRGENDFGCESSWTDLNKCNLATNT